MFYFVRKWRSSDHDVPCFKCYCMTIMKVFFVLFLSWMYCVLGPCPCVHVLVFFLSICVFIKLPVAHEVSPISPSPTLSTVLLCPGSWISKDLLLLLYRSFWLFIFSSFCFLCFLFCCLSFPVIFCTTLNVFIFANMSGVCRGCSDCPVCL